MAEINPTVQDGLVVFFDGMDGTGKTTQLGLAETALLAQGFNVHAARVHGGTPIGEALRSVSLSDIDRPPITDLYIALGMHAALAEQVNIWRQESAIVLIDRSPLSITAYQQYGDGLPAKVIGPFVEGDMALFKPELTLIYTADVETAMARARLKHQGGTDYFESKDSTYFERVSRGYSEAIFKYDAVAVDTETRSIAEVQSYTIDAIHKAILKQQNKA